MSKLFIQIFIIAVTFTAVTNAAPYTTKYDNIDLQEILHNKRLLKGYILCLLDQGPCSPDGAELKKNLPDAMASECSKCSEKQKNSSSTVLHFIIENEPKYWSELEEKYDPKGDYRRKYKEEAKKEGFNI